MIVKIGIFKTSLKENEARVPIYPEHLPRLSGALRSRMFFERNYGSEYGFSESYFVGHGVAICDCEYLLSECDLIVLPKPMPEDLVAMKPGQVLFGWVHCVQQKAITQLAIDRRLTIIAWEAMHDWSESGEKKVHVFYKNNEIAGYASVLHCLQLLGLDGHYGPRRKLVILSYGSVSRGAIYALQGRGFNNIHVFTRRPPYLVADQNPDVYYGQYYFESEGSLMVRDADGKAGLLIDQLSDADIICNGILQDTNKPVIFVQHEDIYRLKPRSLIIDISCDEGMGFAFARPTSFAKPIFRVGEQITYYSVDHTPSYLWNAASREISRALLPYLDIVAAGVSAWEVNPTIKRAIEIRDGVIQNPNILRFQSRRAEYPHEII
ncbi:MAG: alanine dehydrogenase [Syntrophobacteraceae bacterium]|jgi:alanine dehydrogenase